MNELDWRDRSRLTAMLKWTVNNGYSPRKHFLCGVAFCRRVFRPEFGKDWVRAVDAVEEWADKPKLEKKVATIAQRIARAAQEKLSRAFPPYLSTDFKAIARSDDGFVAAVFLASLNIEHYFKISKFTARSVEPSLFHRERKQQCDIARDIFGNPFRPVSFDPAWRTSTAIALAQTMYNSRDFAAMPVLADALEEAGCEVPDVLNHCRDPKGVHVRGCWVVDLVLGKE